MSRCLPFPPQDYQLLSRADYEAIKEKLKVLKADKRKITKRREKKKACKSLAGKRVCSTENSISGLTEERPGPTSSGESTENSNKRRRISCEAMNLIKNGESLNETLIERFENNVSRTTLSSSCDANDKEQENVPFNLGEVIKICEELKTDMDIPTYLDWLFEGKDEGANPRQRTDDFTVMPCISRSTLYPRAQYIKEADIYALPYVLLF